MPQRRTNETYEILVKTPLLRPGLQIRTWVSEKYVVPTLHKLMEKVREFNNSQQDVAAPQSS